MQLTKVRSIAFNRTADNKFMAVFYNKDGDIEVVMDEREIFEGESYILDFGYDMVIAKEGLTESPLV